MIRDVLKAIPSRDSKLEELLEWVRRIKGESKDAKIVIFTEYKDTLYYIKDHLKEYITVSIDGSMSIEDRKKALDEFKFTADIIVGTDAGGEGIDMQFCNIMINYDLPWNPNRLEQRMGRIHRIGQSKNVYYYFVLDPNNTIDGYIFNKLLEKIKSIKAVMKDKVYDVLGKMISEDDIVKIYEELLRAPKDEWEARIRVIDDIIEEKRRIY